MSDKWQQINLRLEAPLAQALRDMKQGHDDPLSEVILRLLWKAVRQQNPLGGRGTPGRSRDGRSREKGPAGRGGFGGKRGKVAAPRGRAAAGKGRSPFVPREAPAAGEWGAEGASAAPRAPRKFGGKPGGKPAKPFRAQPPDASGEAPKRPFRPRPEERRPFRPRDEQAGEARPRRPRKAKATRNG